MPHPEVAYNFADLCVTFAATPPNPEGNASFLSRLFYSYATPLITLGKKVREMPGRAKGLNWNAVCGLDWFDSWNSEWIGMGS